jgi:hypothetical protein
MAARQALDDTWRVRLVPLQVSQETIFVSEPHSAEAAGEEMVDVHGDLMLQQSFGRIGRIRATARVTLEQHLVQVLLFVTSQQNCAGERFSALTALKSLKIFVHLVAVLPVVVLILEQLLAGAVKVKTLDDSRRLCRVPRQVKLVRFLTFEVFAAHQARVQNGAVRLSLVRL